MAATLIAAAGLAIGAAGLFSGTAAADQQAQYQAEALKLQKQEMEERRKAMELDSRRRRREIVRSQIASRSLALATTTASGAQFGSALPGAYGGISGRSGVNDLGVTQNQEIGERIFDLKGQQSDAYRQAAMYGSQAQFGASLTSLGGSMLSNASSLGKLGSTASSYLSS